MPRYLIREDGRIIIDREADSVRALAASIMASTTAGKRRQLSPETIAKKRETLAKVRERRWPKT